MTRALSVVIFLLAASVSGPVVAAPTLLLEGYLTDATDAPLAGEIAMTFELLDGDTAVVGSSSTQTITVTAGRFVASYSAAAPAAFWRDTSVDASAKLRVTVDGSTMEFPLGHAVYAAYAGEAASAASALALRPVSYSGSSLGANASDCGSSFVKGFDLAGQPVCAALPAGNVGDITGVVAGAGLAGSATSGEANLSVDYTQVQQRVNGTCSAGQAMSGVNQAGTVSCQTLAVATDGTSLTGDGISTPIAAITTYLQRRNDASMTGACNGNNLAIKTIAADGTVTCEAETTYSGTAPVNVSGSTISLTAGGVTSDLLAASGATFTTTVSSTVNNSAQGVLAPAISRTVARRCLVVASARWGNTSASVASVVFFNLARSLNGNATTNVAGPFALDKGATAATLPFGTLTFYDTVAASPGGTVEYACRFNANGDTTATVFGCSISAMCL